MFKVAVVPQPAAFGKMLRLARSLRGSRARGIVQVWCAAALDGLY